VADRTDPLSGFSINTQYDPIAGEEANNFVHSFSIKAETANGKFANAGFDITIHSCFVTTPIATEFAGRRLGTENPDYVGPTFTRGPFELILGGSPTNSYSLTPMFTTDDPLCPILYYQIKDNMDATDYNNAPNPSAQ